MKYFTLQTVSEAYKANSDITKNKFWGLLSILSSIKEAVVKPGVNYDFDTTKVSEFLENIFCLDDEKKSYPGSSSTWNIMLSSKWSTKVPEQMLSATPNIYNIIAWYFRTKAFDDAVDDATLIKMFIERIHISLDDAKALFDFSHKDLQFSPTIYTELDLYNQLGISGKNITAEGNSIVAHPGELSRAPFIQTLYAGQSTLECLIITPFKFSELYGGGKNVNRKIIKGLQTIHFGAPGTGKSHYVNNETGDYSVIRTTFHPDSDYSSFVGAYKPEQKFEGKYFTYYDAIANKALDVPVLDANGAQTLEGKITYNFTKQAFLKAYLLAWKKYAESGVLTAVAPSAGIRPITFCNGGSSYTITSVQSNSLTQQREFDDSRTNLSRAWRKCWATGTFVIPSGRISGESVEYAISQWIVNNLENPNGSSLDEGWEKLQSAIKQNGSVEANAPSQKYILSDCDSNKVHVTSSSSRTKESLRPVYENIDDYKGVIERIGNILKSFGDIPFDEAWSKLKDRVESKETQKTDDSTCQTTVEPQFLVIEEINRGNCAQIFGDIFQLLDRQDNGFSSYPIEADSDLQRAIATAFSEEQDYKLSNDIEVDFAVDHYRSNFNQTLSEDIQEGRVLLLPPNLFIWATMNTSDQSLFPMDSAFKRRWDWKHFSIKDEQKGYIIKLNTNGKEYNWWDTINALNEKILAVTKSADKQLGYWFAKLPEGERTISSEQFVSKVVFYLWNDVFKDYSFGGNNPFTKETTFDAFFDNKGEIVEETVEKFLKNIFPEDSNPNA